MASDKNRMRPAPGKMFAGKFLLEENFASGGMGSMWRARDTQRDIPVAIKVMSASVSDSPGFLVRFEREAKAAAQIGSPHVVSIYEFGVFQELPYIVMELLEGEDLQTRLHREKRLSARSTARIVRGVSEALHAAHESGIVHRDLKPANVFLVRVGKNWIVKVLDFGIAKLSQDEEGRITATGQMMGTPHYMSPEQIQGAKDVDHRADLWAIAAIGFRALTGVLPFPGHTVSAIRAILYDTAPPPSKILPEIPPAIDAFFARALARDIDARFQSARELSDALVKAVGREAMKRPDNELDEPTPSGVMLSELGLAPASTREMPLSGEPWSLPPPSRGRSDPPAISAVRPAGVGSAKGSDPPSQEGSDPPPTPLTPSVRPEVASDPPSTLPTPGAPPAPSTLRPAGSGDRPPESLRPPVPLDAPVLPVTLRDSRPMPEMLSVRSSPAPMTPPSSMPSLPSIVPSAPPGQATRWILWIAAATMFMLVGALLAVIVIGR
jgi:serine/threonine-protein kinase